MAFDMSQVQRGARNRRTPYYEATQKHDPKGYTVYNHMYFPIRFDSFEAEFDTLLNGVTLWDVAVERCLEIGGPGRVPVRPAADAARPVHLRRRPGQVRADLRQRRRHHQRPGPHADGREHLLVRARVLGRPAVRARAEERVPRPRRHDPRGGRRAAPGPGAEVEGPDGQADRSRDPRPPLLLLDRGEDRRRAGRDHPHRLDLRGRLRGVPHRHDEGRRGLRRDHGGGGGVRRSARRARATSAGSRARSSTGAPT